MRTQMLVHIMGWLYLGSAQLHKAGQVHVWFCAQGAWRNYEGGRQLYLERFWGVSWATVGAPRASRVACDPAARCGAESGAFGERG